MKYFKILTIFFLMILSINRSAYGNDGLELKLAYDYFSFQQDIDLQARGGIDGIAEIDGDIQGLTLSLRFRKISLDFTYRAGEYDDSDNVIPGFTENIDVDRDDFEFIFRWRFYDFSVGNIPIYISANTGFQVRSETIEDRFVGTFGGTGFIETDTDYLNFSLGLGLDAVLFTTDHLRISTKVEGNGIAGAADTDSSVVTLASGSDDGTGYNFKWTGIAELPFDSWTIFVDVGWQIQSIGFDDSVGDDEWQGIYVRSGARFFF